MFKCFLPTLTSKALAKFLLETFHSMQTVSTNSYNHFSCLAGHKPQSSKMRSECHCLEVSTLASSSGDLGGRQTSLWFLSVLPGKWRNSTLSRWLSFPSASFLIHHSYHSDIRNYITHEAGKGLLNNPRIYQCSKTWLETGHLRRGL
jgi:hypothetical protein